MNRGSGLEAIDDKRVESTSGGPNRVKGVLFDLDGTLIDSIPLILSSLRHAIKTVLGQELVDDELLRNVGTPLVRQMQEFSPEHSVELLVAYREHNAIHHDAAVRAYPGVAETLMHLKGMGYPIGIATSKAGEGARRGLSVAGLESFIDTLVSCDDTDSHKPDPAPLKLAAERLGVPITTCVYVGDSEFDIMAAKACKAISVAALWGPFPEAVVVRPGPSYALASISDLPGLLDRLNRGE